MSGVGYGKLPFAGRKLMASILEATMLLCFGRSWPINALNAWRARTAKTTSPAFLALITFGYVAGIAAKFVGHNVNWVLGVYLFNLVALVINDLIYVRNRRLDAQAGIE
jgi:hypothetical protein